MFDVCMFNSVSSNIFEKNLDENMKRPVENASALGHKPLGAKRVHNWDLFHFCSSKMLCEPGFESPH